LHQLHTVSIMIEEPILDLTLALGLLVHILHNSAKTEGLVMYP
jgi:hypothetical protein